MAIGKISLLLKVQKPVDTNVLLCHSGMFLDISCSRKREWMLVQCGDSSEVIVCFLLFLGVG